MMRTSNFKKMEGVKVAKIVKARDYWIFLVA